MPHYEYKVIPAPTKGRKAQGVKGAEARFAHAIEETLNELAKDGWSYVRADLLPSEERQGLTSSQTIYRSVLVFQREITEDLPAVFTDDAPQPEDEPKDEPAEDPELETEVETDEAPETTSEDNTQDSEETRPSN